MKTNGRRHFQFLRVLRLIVILIVLASVVICVTFISPRFEPKSSPGPGIQGSAADHDFDRWFQYFLLDLIILGITFLVALLWGLVRILLPNWKPKWLKPVGRTRYRTMSIIFAVLLLIFKILAILQVRDIVMLDYSQEGPGPGPSYEMEGICETVTLISTEGLMLSLYGLAKRTREQKNGENNKHGLQ